ncbi:type I polyketide synthase [Endothiovibrio diazotrophicus]
MDFQDHPESDIAVIGMAGRFPKAPDLEAFWRNLREGVECVQFFSPEELAEAGVDPALAGAPEFVNARAVLEQADWFDAGFFGMTPKEAELTDPQQRLFLECAWQALEDAGCDPQREAGLVGVFAGADVNGYTLRNLAFSGAGLQALIGNDKDYLATRVCYKLDLHGPGVSVQTACSTSLVAVQMAAQALLGYQCDVALAGGVGVAFPQKGGYLYQDGGILSPDGHCRPFDAEAAGTVGGDGVGAVVLKRLDEALRDGDPIHAVIKGAAINNDGAVKVGFTAPGVQGQTEVISLALAAAGVEPDSIGYVETHGTGTALGDPIEVSALSQVFRARTERKQFCAIGSLKSNVGHMNSAAGVGSLIKTILALRHRQIPPSLHYEAPNPRIDFAASPFYVNTALRDWPRGETPRRAGVSSFGIGGTNAHVVLEEAPQRGGAAANREWQLLTLSARSQEALENACGRLAAHLENHPEQPLAEVAYTLQAGRRRFAHRRWLVCREHGEALEGLRGADARSVSALVNEPGEAEVAFLFPGQGAQSVNMARDLYAGEPRFREELNRCLDGFAAETGRDLPALLYPPAGGEAAAAAELEQTALTQPLLFAVEYALARLWQSWGVEPAALLGHSLGEYTAACLAGVFTLEEGLKLVAARGRLMQAMEPGAMLSVPLSEVELRGRFPEMELAAVNAPARCVLTGSFDAVAAVERQLEAEGVASKRLHTSHAFHSALMEPMLDQFRAVVAGVALAAPRIPMISNVTGSWLSDAEATSPDYWVRHARMAVRFSDGLGELAAAPQRVFLEVGPGGTLAALAGQRPGEQLAVVTSLPGPREERPATPFLLDAVGRLDALGVAVDWAAFHGGEPPRKVSLPTYPFERERYGMGWNELARLPAAANPLEKGSDPGRWLYRPGWKRAAPEGGVATEGGRWLLLLDGEGSGRELLPAGLACIEVVPGEGFARLDDHRYRLDPASRDDHRQLFDALAEAGALPERVVDLRGLAPEADATAHCLALFRLAQALAEREGERPVTVDLLTRGLFDVTGDEPLTAERATLLGPAQVISQEYPRIRCRLIDVALPADPAGRQALGGRLWTELATAAEVPQIAAYRGRYRWVPSYEPSAAPVEEGLPSPLREGGCYLITGGLGTIGLTLAEYLARNGAGALVLTSRSGLPPAEEWDQWLAYHDSRDRVSAKIQGVRGLQALGAEVLVSGADVADRASMAALVAEIQGRFGRLDGAVHCAGIISPRELLRSVRDTEAEHLALHFRPKVDGVRVLEEVLPDDIAFCALCSSLSTVLGGVGFAAYAAANHYLDAFAAQRNRSSPFPWIAIGWDGWLARDDAGEGPLALARFSLAPKEGAQVFERILHRPPEARWVIATTDLAARIAFGEARREGQAEEAAAVADAAERHQRPALDTEYVAPRNELEREIAAIWQELLGFDEIGIHDSFFRLGGDSLAAIQLGSRLREAFQVDLTVHSLFDEPTIAALAERIEGLRAEGAQAAASEEEELLRKLEMVENMSEEEVAAMLAAMEEGP